MVSPASVHVQLVRVHVGSDKYSVVELTERRGHGSNTGGERVAQRDIAFICDYGQIRSVEVGNAHLENRALAEPLYGRAVDL